MVVYVRENRELRSMISLGWPLFGDCDIVRSQ